MGVPARLKVASAEDGRNGRDGHPTICIAYICYNWMLGMQSQD